MAAAGNNVGGTLVIDAPESSLDAVFERRAANVLTKFASPEKNNRLVVTSNLVAGDLIPLLVKLAKQTPDDKSRVVNLLDVAIPTAALRQNRAEYDRVLGEIVGPA